MRANNARVCSAFQHARVCVHCYRLVQLETRSVESPNSSAAPLRNCIESECVCKPSDLIFPHIWTSTQSSAGNRWTCVFSWCDLRGVVWEVCFETNLEWIWLHRDKRSENDTIPPLSSRNGIAIVCCCNVPQNSHNYAVGSEQGRLSAPRPRDSYPSGRCGGGGEILQAVEAQGRNWWAMQLGVGTATTQLWLHDIPHGRRMEVREKSNLEPKMIFWAQQHKAKP